MLLRYVLTARDSEARLSEQPALEPSSVETPGLPVLTVDTAHQFQIIEGFGGAFTEAGAVSWMALSPNQRDAALRAYFATQAEDGHGYALCRVHMNSCDFALDNYAHVQTTGDVDLRSFNISRDQQALLPFIKTAQRVTRHPIKLLASPWSPPAWMKTNGSMNHGGKLRPEYRLAWARCFVRFIEAYAQEGVPIWGVTVQNEPMATQRWDSCVYSAEEERDFIRDYLGPELVRAGLADIKIVVWDHNRDLMVDRASVIYGDPEASKYAWGLGFHWYGEDHFDHVQRVHDAWPEKRLLFTEGCQEGGAHMGSWALGERYAHSMINDLNRWTVGWIDWNLFLDLQGGPNHVGNFCSAPILIDTAHDALYQQSSFYYIGHFCRFVVPGARRVLCASSVAALECTAFRNPDGSPVLIVLNRTDAPVSFMVRLDGSRFLTQIPGHAIVTLAAAVAH